MVNSGREIKMSAWKKILIAVVVIVVLVFVGIEIYAPIMQKKKEKNLADLTQSYAEVIESIISNLTSIPDSVAGTLGDASYSDAQINETLKSIVKGNVEIYGSTYSMEPYMHNKDSLYYAPYFYQRDGNIYYQNLGTPSYSYFTWGWYLIPKRLGKPVWSEPYFDQGGGNIDMITYSAPVYKHANGNKNFVGILTIDLSLHWINKIVGPIDLENNGYALLVSQAGTVIGSNNSVKNWRLKQTIFSIAKENSWHGFRQIGKKIVAGKTGTEQFTDSEGNPYVVSYLPLGNNNLYFMIAMKEDKI
jgi:phosphoserine phosphatase RsbU/P